MVTFPRPVNNNVRGIHWSASTTHASPVSNWSYWRDQLQSMGIGWVKLLDDGGATSLKMCQLLLGVGIVPVVRMYRPQPNPAPMPQPHLASVSLLVQSGVRYFEPNNEPNLRQEWDDPTWRTKTWQQKVELSMQSWIVDANNILSVGGLPGFPALAQCAHSTGDNAIGSIPFYVEAFRWLKANANSQAVELFSGGAWLAVHDSPLNHCYQDTAGVWHFEYPLDPVCQADQPGKTILDDDNSLIGHRVPQSLLKQYWDVSVPVISTEGGVFMPVNGWQQWDTRYPGYNYDGQATRTVAMFDWLVKNEPAVWGMCPWLIANETMGHTNPAWTNDAWYPEGTPRPVVAAMKASVPVPAPTDAQIREAAWNAAGFAYNPAAAFQKYAGSNDLGVPLTAEFTVGDQTVQGYALGIVCCKTGDWGNVRHIPWSENAVTAASVGGLRARIRVALGRG